LGKCRDSNNKGILVVKKGIKFIETETKMTKKEIEAKIAELDSRL